MPRWTIDELKRLKKPELIARIMKSEEERDWLIEEYQMLDVPVVTP